MPFDMNMPLEDRTDFSRQEAIPEGDYKVRIADTEFVSQAEREKRKEAKIAAGYEAKDPAGPMGVVTYEILTGEHAGSTSLKDYLWLQYLKDGEVVRAKRQYQRVVTILHTTGVLDEGKKLTPTQVETGLEKAMASVRGKQLSVTVKHDKEGRSEIVAFSMGGNPAPSTSGNGDSGADEVPF